MSTRRNYTTNTVTAGKFVEIGKSAQDLKAKLRRINLISNSSDNTAQISGIEQIAGDSVITPSEKRLLAEEWEHIVAAYNSTVSLVNQLDINPNEFVAFNHAFESLKTMVEGILADMTTESKTDGRLQVLVEAYNSAASILQDYITAYQNGLTQSISSYRLQLTSVPTSPEPDDTIVFTASIFIDGVDSTEDLMQSYIESDGRCPALFNWDIEGTTDDEGYMEDNLGRRVLSIPASDFSSDRITVAFSSKISVG